MKLNNKNFIKLLNKNYIFENNPKVAVGVSGGPDSMALVFLINKWIKLKKGGLIALIFDHKIRKESNYESKMIKRYLDESKIDSSIITVSKNKVLKYNMNEARVNRFKGLLKYCKKNNILHLFLAHHYDDNLETFLTRKVSGSNLEGLSSIKNLSYRENIQIIRPLLNFSKQKILNYNNINKNLYLTDPNNYNFKYTRVAIRYFIESNNKIELIKKDFKRITSDVFLYKKMIWEILHQLLIAVKKNSIELNYLDLLKVDDLIIERQINAIYRFFFIKKYNLRSSKIKILIRDLRKNEFKKFNIGSLIVEKNDCILKFYGKII